MDSMELLTLPSLPMCCAIDCLLRQTQIASNFYITSDNSSTSAVNSRNGKKCRLDVRTMSLEAQEGTPVFSNLFQLLNYKSMPQLYCRGVYIQQPRTIMKFIASYCQSSWYPKETGTFTELLLRSKIDDLMDIDSSIIYPEINRYCLEQFYQASEMSDEPNLTRQMSTSTDQLKDCLSILCDNLQGARQGRFLTGYEPSIVDISVGFSIEYLILSGYEIDDDLYSEINRWLHHCRSKIDFWKDSLQPLKSWIEWSKSTSDNNSIAPSISTYRRLSWHCIGGRSR
ncbi:uncharacterized protein LOC142335457 isoform X1 [Convolutriloba macropyga]|uniref:uncharacterized protein LOC142335457 isoform X1 n=1 Tax=Convolutriloba macropyga TaxID=536237 RepID=UPI003F51AD73